MPLMGTVFRLSSAIAGVVSIGIAACGLALTVNVWQAPRVNVVVRLLFSVAVAACALGASMYGIGHVQIAARAPSHGIVEEPHAFRVAKKCLIVFFVGVAAGGVFALLT